MKAIRWIALAALAAAMGCGVPVAVESDPGARHGGWRSWSWLGRPPVARGDTELAAVDDRVRASFEREMGTRGFRKVERERPDFLVTYYAAVTRPIEAKAIEYAAGGPASNAAVAKTGAYEQGMLIVDLLDAKTGKLAWRGTGRRVFQAEHEPQDRSERIVDAVAAIVSEFAAR